MIISVKVQTQAREDKIEEIGIDSYKVWVVESPQSGRANEALIEVLSDYFNVAPSLIKIKSGNKSTNKLVEIYSE